MTRFIWVRDINKVDHYINVNNITRVTKAPGSDVIAAYSYLIVNDGTVGGKVITLSQDKYDTADDVITKIQVASA